MTLDEEARGWALRRSQWDVRIGDSARIREAKLTAQVSELDIKMHLIQQAIDRLESENPDYSRAISAAQAIRDELGAARG